MFELMAGNHHGAGWMTTGFAIFLWCLLPFTLGLYVTRLVRDVQNFRRADAAARADLSDRLFGWVIAVLIHAGALFLAAHRIAAAL